MIRAHAARGLQTGDTFSVERTFFEEDVAAFARISRDYNPVHFERRFARVKGFRGRICHGLLVASMVTEVGGQIGWLATGMQFRFRRPVYIGETITCELTVMEIHEQGRARAEARFLNRRGEVVLEGEVRGYVPGPDERAVLRAMIREGDSTNPLAEPDAPEGVG